MIATLQVKKDRLIIVTDAGRRYNVEFDDFIYVRKGSVLIPPQSNTPNNVEKSTSKYEISFFYKSNIKPTNASVSLTQDELKRVLFLTKLSLEEATAL